MLKLVAVQYQSGIACVFDGQQYLVLKPPYSTENFCKISPAEVGQAISKQGFAAEDKDFATFEELFKFLGEKLLKGEWETK
jgi:hypothetical protein